MLMAMMDIRVMRVSMTELLVFVHMSMCLRQQLGFDVMLMMLVVTVPMLMFHGFVNVRVAMFLRQV
jgi:hypothetical protein